MRPLGTNSQINYVSPSVLSGLRLRRRQCKRRVPALVMTVSARPKANRESQSLFPWKPGMAASGQQGLCRSLARHIRSASASGLLLVRAQAGRGGPRHTRYATCAALPVPALRRPHDCDRGLRARLRAKVVARAKQDRYVMSRTTRERHHLLVPMRWLHAGGDLSRPNHANQRADRRSIRSTRRPRFPLHPSRLPCAHPCRSPGAGIAPTFTADAKIKSP
jgi:hypothetical protein